jgi:hypothetical protein
MSETPKPVDERSARAVDQWLVGLPRTARRELYMLLDELVCGRDVSRHNRAGFLRLRAEFETSGEIFGAPSRNCAMRWRPPSVRTRPNGLGRGVRSKHFASVSAAADTPISAENRPTRGGMSPSGISGRGSTTWILPR